MKIAYVIHRFPWPSETFISREIADLMALGLSIEVYAFEGPGPAEVALLTPAVRALMDRTTYIGKAEAAWALASPQALSILGSERQFSRSGATCGSRLLRLGRAAALARHFRKSGITQIRAHWPYATQCVHLASLASGLPYSVSIHAHEVAHDAGHFPACFERLTFATFCNVAAMEYLLPRLPASARGKSQLIYHGVDVTAFREQPPAKAPPPLRVLSAGRLTASKGFDRLVAACAEAVRRGLDIELTILGRGPEEGTLRRVADEQGFAGRLHLPGWVPHDDVGHYLAACHVFALMAADNFNDGLPNVVVEAMASGRPVILSPLPAAREIIESGRNGFVLASVDDAEGLISVLETLMIDGAAAGMAEAARAKVMSEYDARHHIRSLAALIERHEP